MGKAATYPERKKAAMYGKIEVWQNRAAGILLILLLCIQPLYLSSARYIGLTRQKFVFFVVYMVIILLIVLIIWIVRLASKPMLGIRERPYLADWAVLGFAIVTLLSAIFSPFRDQVNVWIGIPEPYGRYDGAISQLLYVAVFLIISHWYKPNIGHFVVFGISATLVALIGILQFYGMDFLKLWPNHIPEYHVENFYEIFFRSTLGNVDIVSTYVCAAILLCGFLYIKVSSKWKPLWLVASALNFWLMELADADSGRIGIIAVVLLSIPYIIENKKMIGRTLLLFASWALTFAVQRLLFDVLIMDSRTVLGLLPLIAAVVLLLVAGILLSLKGKESASNGASRWKLGLVLIVLCIAAGVAGIEVLGRRGADSVETNIVYEMREIMHGNITDEIGTNRVYIWRNALKAYPEHPFIGTGPDTFEHAFPAEAHGKYGETYDKAHNEYIQILICQGILGLICYLVFLAAPFLKAIPKAFKNPMLMPVLAAFVGYCVQAFFNISLPIASQMLWVFAGILANKHFAGTNN